MDGNEIEALTIYATAVLVPALWAAVMYLCQNVCSWNEICAGEIYYAARPTAPMYTEETDTEGLDAVSMFVDS